MEVWALLKWAHRFVIPKSLRKLFPFLIDTWFRTSLAPGTRRRDSTRVGSRPLENWETSSSLVITPRGCVLPGVPGQRAPLQCAEQALGIHFWRQLSKKQLHRNHQCHNPASPWGQSFTPSSHNSAQGSTFCSSRSSNWARLSSSLQVHCGIWRTAIFLLKCRKEGHTDTKQQNLPSPCVPVWWLPLNHLLSGHWTRHATEASASQNRLTCPLNNKTHTNKQQKPNSALPDL